MQGAPTVDAEPDDDASGAAVADKSGAEDEDEPANDEEGDEEEVGV